MYFYVFFWSEICLELPHWHLISLWLVHIQDAGILYVLRHTWKNCCRCIVFWQGLDIFVQWHFSCPFDFSVIFFSKKKKNTLNREWPWSTTASLKTRNSTIWCFASCPSCAPRRWTDKVDKDPKEIPKLFEKSWKIKQVLDISNSFEQSWLSF